MLRLIITQLTLAVKGFHITFSIRRLHFNPLQAKLVDYCSDVSVV